GGYAVATIPTVFPIDAGIRVYDLDSLSIQELRTSESTYTSVGIKNGLIAARADRVVATFGECGEVHTFEQDSDGDFQVADVIEHACNMSGSIDDEGRRILVQENRIFVNGRIDWDDGRLRTLFGSFDLFERVDGVWSRSEDVYFPLAGTYSTVRGEKVGGLAVDGDSVILDHQWRGRMPVGDCGFDAPRGALSVFDSSSDYCRADVDADRRLTVFDFLAFANAFEDASPIADFEWDGFFTLNDYLLFLNQFDAGCP
ncbi:MAG: hypothetical protein HRU13_09825, partial [Phycisphaerales bacterium]|nr:hypothetical protein [Phycisphaerales bacterium]